MGAPARSREDFLDARIEQLADYWLMIRCTAPCQFRVDYPLKLMARQHGFSLRVRDVLPRLKCKRCGARPSSVVVTDDPAAQGRGGPPQTWTVVLVP